MKNIYTSGQYLEARPTWHAEDSSWKANQISKIICTNHLQPKSIAEIGCGAGVILYELSKKPHFQDVSCRGYDLSPQAIGLAKQTVSEAVDFYCDDLLSEQNQDRFDILLIIDVFEHIPDYMGFVEKCREKAEYKIYHIPLDIHVSSLLRNGCIASRHTIGHLHYFTAESAVGTLRDTGHEIVDSFYTNGAFDLFQQHPSFKRATANIPRWLFSKLSVPLTARLFGGYSLLILAR